MEIHYEEKFIKGKTWSAAGLFQIRLQIFTAIVLLWFYINIYSIVNELLLQWMPWGRIKGTETL